MFDQLEKRGQHEKPVHVVLGQWVKLRATGPIGPTGPYGGPIGETGSTGATGATGPTTTETMLHWAKRQSTSQGGCQGRQDHMD